ncbi:MAG: threonylcarbamoyl-AMP synthase [Bacteroidetes bacterium]|nr:threonylcarbamoyl-AMP synthase [Bacteroidota bacterium]|tara:strand:- start:169 stop:735 length:567 start_codon:yes stop_codon:yes gene_type:complete
MMRDIVHKSVKLLKEGKVILYPTDTVWGIGCDATNAKAVEKVYKIKKRVESKSLIILVEDESRLAGYMQDVPDIAYDLIDSVDKPLTVIYPNAKNLAKNVIAEDKSIAIRVVKNEFCQELLRQFRKPIVSTSANVSGEPTPVTFHKISQEVKDAVDYVVEVERDSLNQVKPSTIIKLEADGTFKIIRK